MTEPVVLESPWCLASHMHNGIEHNYFSDLLTLMSVNKVEHCATYAYYTKLIAVKISVQWAPVGIRKMNLTTGANN